MIPAAAACALALVASLAAPAVPWAYASALAYEGDAGDPVYVDDDDDGYDDNTDEWIGFGTAAAAKEAEGKSAASSSKNPAGPDGGSTSKSSSATSSAATGPDDSGASAGKNDTGDGKSESSESKSASSVEKDKDKPTSSAFTFAGTGTTVDNATSGEGVEFFTIKAEGDEVYYLVVDRNSGAENVYLLDAVTGSDLEPLAESGKINLGTPAAAAPAEEKEEEKAEQDEPRQQGAPEWLAYLVVVAVVGGGAFAYYRLKVKPEREESKVDERDVRSFEDDGIYPPANFGQYGNWDK